MGFLGNVFSLGSTARLLLGLPLLVACASARPSAATPTAGPPVATPDAAPRIASGGPGELALSSDPFAAEHVHGGIALFDSRDGQLRCTDRALCEAMKLPASTFKIPHTVIALETGVVDDAESKLPWDGTQYAVPEWNHDHTLRTAIQVSCFPCFRAIARKIGPDRMREWVTRLDYGNHDIGGKPDAFWLDGALRVSQSQQIDFLRRLDGEKLPISPRTLEIVRDVLTLDVAPDYVLRGKTGSAMPPEQPMEAGWFVGWVELGERRVFFATLIDGHDPGIDALPLRRVITERVLRELSVLPPK